MSESCVVCKKSTRIIGTIECRDCKRGCHLPCVNLTKPEVDVLVSENLLWRCPPCSDARLKSVRLLFALDMCNITLQQMISLLSEAKVAGDKTAANMANEFLELTSEQLENPQMFPLENSNLKMCAEKLEKIKETHESLAKTIADLNKKFPELEKFHQSKDDNEVEEVREAEEVVIAGGGDGTAKSNECEVVTSWIKYTTIQEE